MEEKGKKLGLINLLGLGLGSAIGTGIFIMLGFGIAHTGRSIVLVCVAGCFFMLLAYWYNTAMSTMFVVKSGDYGLSLIHILSSMSQTTSLTECSSILNLLTNYFL